MSYSNMKRGFPLLFFPSIRLSITSFTSLSSKCVQAIAFSFLIQCLKYFFSLLPGQTRIHSQVLLTWSKNVISLNYYNTYFVTYFGCYKTISLQNQCKILMNKTNCTISNVDCIVICLGNFCHLNFFSNKLK